PDQPDLDATVAKLGTDGGYRLQCADAMRKKANVNRATDVATAALVKRLQRDKDLRKRLEAWQPKDGELNEDVQLSSISLVTAGLTGGEGKMLKDQLEAWEAISKNPPVVTLLKQDGKTRVSVKLDVAVNAFNFGVNLPALSMGPGITASNDNKVWKVN